MTSSKIRFLLAIFIAGLIGYYVGVSKISFEWKNYTPRVSVANKETPPTLRGIDFSQFWQVMEKLEEGYYDKKAIDHQKMLNGAISGMVDSLDDPYTVYLPPKQNDNFKQGLAGQFEGIGAELGLKGKQIIVVAPLDGSPAQSAGVRAGDAILMVDGKPTAGWSLNQAVEKIRGQKGTVVALSMGRKDVSKPVEIKITRGTITVKSITAWTKKIKDIEGIDVKASGLKGRGEEKVAYIRLSQFGDSAHGEWEQAAASVSQQLKADSSIKGLVFDLRNNPGGYLPDAIFIASEFIKSGVGVMQEDRNGDKELFRVSGNGVLTDVPLVILINKGSASASEIVSGAIRDHKWGKLVGETSFGKGTIQQAEDLGEGAGLHVTIAKWLTPEGTWVHKDGLKPDVEVGLDKKDPSHDMQLEKGVETLLGDN